MAIYILYIVVTIEVAFKMNKFWFRRRLGLFSKDLGWGWTPISWQGWILTLLAIGFIVWIYATKGQTWDFLLYALLTLFLFGMIADSKSFTSY